MKKFKVTYKPGDEHNVDEPTIVHEVYAETSGDAYSEANRINRSDPDFMYWHYYSMPEIEEVEIHGNPFDWYKELREMIKIQKACQNKSVSADFYEKKYRVLADNSGTWISCACGNACAIIPRNCDGEPIDVKLSRLGILFYEAIALEHDFSTAIKVLHEIEDRSKILIAQEIENLKDPNYVPPTGDTDRLPF